MNDDTTSRRRYLQLTSAAAGAALAGCLGSDGGESTEVEMIDDTEDGMMEETATDDGMTDETEDGMMATTFAVTVENVSTGDTLETMDGGVAVPLSPGVYAVHSGMAHVFTPGETASPGLEALAEDGMPGTLAEEVADAEGVLNSGAFTTPTGADGPAPLKPGETYEFEVAASADADPSLSLATMFVQSNDLFYAPGVEGIPLFSDGEPVSGEVTEGLALWDAGTEVNQCPGEGDDQAPRQSGPDTGEDEDGTVRRIVDIDDGFDYPAVADVIRVSVAPQ